MDHMIADEQTTQVQTGVTAGTRIMTLDGLLAVEFLQPGDRIVTSQGVRYLCGLRIVVRKNARSVIVRASALGHDRPEADITLAADHPLLVRDWRARAPYGSAQATVPAAKLVDGEYISLRMVEELRTFDLLFDTPQVVYAEGAEIAMIGGWQTETEPQNRSLGLEMNHHAGGRREQAMPPLRSERLGQLSRKARLK